MKQENSQLLIASTVSFICGILAHRTYSNFFVKIQTAAHLSPNSYGRWMKGFCVKVPDGDNFRLIHLPFGSVSKSFKKSASSSSSTKETVHVRLMGIDTPESGHFGMPAQPMAKESREYLEKLLLQRIVYFKPLMRDQYHRLVSTVLVLRWPFRFLIPPPLRLLFPMRHGFLYKNVSLDLVKKGYAMLYEQANSQYDGCYDELKQAQEKAKRKRLGVWQLKHFIPPSEHKKKHLK
jgi:endonuclease YncB( thermonuclease family)